MFTDLRNRDCLFNQFEGGNQTEKAFKAVKWISKISGRTNFQSNAYLPSGQIQMSQREIGNRVYMHPKTRDVDSFFDKHAIDKRF